MAHKTFSSILIEMRIKITRLQENSIGGSGRIRDGILGCENEAKNAMNKRLRLISGREQLILRPTDGNDTLARATDVFSYIDSNFKNWACDVEGQRPKKPLCRFTKWWKTLRCTKCSVVSKWKPTVRLLHRPRSNNSWSAIPTDSKKAVTAHFFCSRLAVNFSSQPCISSQTVAWGYACAACRSIASSWPRSVIDWWFRSWRSNL